MASLSIARPVRGTAGSVPAPADGSGVRLTLRVRIDPEGTVQSVEGHWPAIQQAISAGANYYHVLESLCGGGAELAEAVRAGIRAVWAGHTRNFSLEFEARLPDGEMQVALVAAPYRQGSVKGILLTHTDAGAEDPQEFKMEALGRLAGGVAHDFANLVTTIAGYSEILLSRLGAEDAGRPELEEIRRTAARGAIVTSEILGYIRKQTAVPGGVQLNALITEMSRMLRPIIGEHITLTVNLDPRLGIVNADLTQMSRVLMNLLLNARDAMPHGGAIAIRTANMQVRLDSWHGLPPGRYVMLEISDTGTGMDAETLRQIFQPFFSTKGGGGTGLGLSTVHRIVEHADGRIWARSQPDQGTTFTICLPRAEENFAAGDTDSGPRPIPSGKETILLAEDEESVRKLLRHILDSSGYHIIEAADGREAWRLFQENAEAIDLLLTDIIMPGMNGRELFQRAQTAKPGLKVIYMSGYTEDVLVNMGPAGPDVTFLAKPLKLDVLSTTIREVLDAPVAR